LNLWQRAALAGRQSAYEEGGEREDLMDFLHRLTEAFCIIHACTRAQQGLPIPAVPGEAGMQDAQKHVAFVRLLHFKAYNKQPYCLLHPEKDQQCRYQHPENDDQYFPEGMRFFELHELESHQPELDEGEKQDGYDDQPGGGSRCECRYRQRERQ